MINFEGMTNETSKKAIEQALTKICNHQLFANSSVYTRLLTYLVEKAFIEEELKEFTIGADLFGENYIEDKNDGKVRSYMYKLRKKLELYYAKEGAQEQVFFEIKKGQYNLSFSSHNNYFKPKTSKDLKLRIPIKAVQYSSISLVLVAVIGWILIEQLNKPLPIWKPFFEKNASNMVVLSDQFSVDELFEEGKFRAVSYPEINNPQDFLNYTRKYPDKKIKTNDYTMVSKMAPFSTKTLTHWFDSYKKDFTLQLESKLSYEDVKENNIVFVGQFKTMNLSKSLFLKDSKHFTTYLDGFKFTKNDTVKIYDTTHGENGKIEYAMVSFVSISPGKSAIYFVSNNDIGVMATLRNFTDKKWLTDFYKKLNSNTNHFNALFEVSGLQRTDISCTMVALEIVE